MIFTIVTWLAFVGYVIGGWQQRQTIISIREPNQSLSKHQAIAKPVVISIVAWLLHALNLFGHAYSQQGLLLDLGTAMSMTAWCMTGVVIAISYRQPAASLLVAMLPFSAICILFTALVPTSAEPITASLSHSPAFLTHIVFSFTAYALLSVAALFAIVLAYQINLLKKHQPHPFLRIVPPLQAMDSLLFGMLSTGLVLLTLSLLSGFLFIEDIFAQQLAHKTVLSVCAWFVFTGLLAGHYYFGWRGRTAVRWTLTGFGFLLVAFFGSKIIIEYLL